MLLLQNPCASGVGRLFSAWQWNGWTSSSLLFGENYGFRRSSSRVALLPPPPVFRKRKPWLCLGEELTGHCNIFFPCLQHEDKRTNCLFTTSAYFLCKRKINNSLFVVMMNLYTSKHCINRNNYKNVFFHSSGHIYITWPGFNMVDLLLTIYKVYSYFVVNWPNFLYF